MGRYIHVGTRDLGLIAAGINKLGGIGPQFLSMAVDGKVGWISKKLLLPYHVLHGGLLFVGKCLEEGRILQRWLQ